MRIIGIVGGIASGKSLVAGQLAQLGAGILDADRAGHEALKLPEVEEAVRQRWGNAVFGLDGHVDRASLAQVVFAGPDAERERNYLEKLIHPEIAKLISQQSEAIAASGVEIAVLDAPLLIEAGWDDLCEQMVFVDAPRSMRWQRAAARGWNEQEFAAREGAQESLDRKRACADVIIDNSGSPERTQAQVEQFWASLLR